MISWIIERIIEMMPCENKGGSKGELPPVLSSSALLAASHDHFVSQRYSVTQRFRRLSRIFNAAIAF